MEEKHCNQCGTKKRLDQFYKARTGRQGRAGVCKKCHSANVVAARDRDAFNAYQREYMRRTYIPKGRNDT